jgi:hypothetical protein
MANMDCEKKQVPFRVVQEATSMKDFVTSKIGYVEWYSLQDCIDYIRGTDKYHPGDYVQWVQKRVGDRWETVTDDQLRVWEQANRMAKDTLGLA